MESEMNTVERQSEGEEYFDVLPIPFISLDLQGNILAISSSAAELLGQPKSSLKHKNLNDFLNDEQKHVLHNLLLETFIYKGKTVVGSLEVLSQNKTKTLEIHSSTPKVVNPQAANFLIIDNKSKRMQNSELSRMREKEKMISALFHDIRTPMTSVMLAAQMLKSNRTSLEKKHRLFDILTDELNRTDGMIRTLLNVAQKKSHIAETLPMSWCNFREIAFKCIETMNELQNFERDVLFVFKGECFSGHYNKESLLRITENLINNARKYGFRETRVTVTLEDLGTSVSLKVHNFGEPIPEKELSKIFKVFHRCKGAMSGPHAGWGLGLSLVHDLVKLHSGTIEVSSSLDQGTTFTIELPKEPLTSSKSALSYL